MGTTLFDNYSLLHFAAGIVAYFWGLGFWSWTALHALFELVENTEFGMASINRYIKAWPGGKPFADAPINSLGDVIAGSLGWLLASLVSST